MAELNFHDVTVGHNVIAVMPHETKEYSGSLNHRIVAYGIQVSMTSLMHDLRYTGPGLGRVLTVAGSLSNKSTDITKTRPGRATVGKISEDIVWRHHSRPTVAARTIVT